ncbi:MAG TPA: hypothetical protein PKG60_07195 [Spirochaetota bacterium]|nr:hypothetical protein [Spirochaetota bacterium]
MTKGNFRKRRREIDAQRIDLLPIDIFPEDAILHEFQGRRVSNILLDFASPLVSKIDAANAFQFKLMLYFAAVAWNFSYFREGDERKEALDRFLLNSDQFSGDKKNQMYTIVNSLALRKKKSFWQYDFMLVNFETVKGEKDSTVMACAIPYSLINIESVFGKIN